MGWGGGMCIVLVAHSRLSVYEVSHFIFRQYPKTGAILVFLPGMGEIMTLLEQLQNNRTFSPKSSDR